jgi:hypothetical protein
MQPDIRAQLVAVIGDTSPLLAPDAQIAVRVGDTEGWVPLLHLRALIQALGRDDLRLVADGLSQAGQQQAGQSPA